LGNYLRSGSYNATGFQSDLANQDLAAATTDKDYGIRQAIAAQASVAAADVGVVSLARFGAKSADIPQMIARWQTEEADSIKRKPDYILVALGGNDFCSDTSVEIISETMKREMEAIYQTAPDARMIIAPSPPVSQLAAIDFTYGPTVSQITGEELSCRKFREQFCKNVYAPDAEARLQGINQGIQAAFQNLKDKGAKVSFASGVLQWKILADELAFDCFHPSQKGQSTLGSYFKAALDSAP